MTRGIYRIRNTATGDCYIGKSRNVERRWAQHRTALRYGYTEIPRLIIAVWLYGLDMFAFEVLEEVAEDISLGEREQHYINYLAPEYNTTMSVHGHGLNLHPDKLALYELQRWEGEVEK